MATETGTATDYRDLLQKLKLFLTGQSVSPIGSNGLSWVVEEERSQYTSPLTDIAAGDADELMETAANNNQSHDQIIFRGNGGTSPEKEIYFGIQTYGLSSTGYYNWQIRGLTGFSTSSPQYVSLANQPGRSPPTFLPLQNTTMTYWFIANNRRVMGAVKTGTAYQLFYIGLLNPYATDAEYPYPMAVFGTYHSENIIFSSNSILSASMLNPGGNSNTAAVSQATLYPAQQSTGYVRFVDGSWYGVKNFRDSSGNELTFGFSASEEMMATYPLATPGTLGDNHDEGNEILNTEVWGSDFKTTTAGGTPNYQQVQAMGSPQQTVMWPVVVFKPVGEQLVGDFDGIYWVPGAGGFTSEDTITDTGESPEVQHIVFQSTWRTDAWMFVGMRNE